MTVTDPQPTITPSPDAVPFWTALTEHRLDLPYCERCQTAFFYPRSLCPGCGSREVTWRTASGRGRLYSFCVIHHSAVPGLSGALPVVTGLVDLDEGPRVMAYLRGFPSDPEQIRCDVAVEATYLDLADGGAVLAFTPAG